MASKKQSEGMALLSMYEDEDEEMAELKQEDVEEDNLNIAIHEEHESFDNDFFISNPIDNLPPSPLELDSQKFNLFGTISPHISQVSRQSPLMPLASSMMTQGEYQRRKTKLTIVDYGHDEAQMSPDPEEGEIRRSGFGDHNSEAFTYNENFTDDTFTLKFQVESTVAHGATSFIEQMIMDTVDIVGVESETEVSPDIQDVTSGGTDVDYLAMFLPPPPKNKCSEELQGKINKFLAYKRLGKSFNSEVRNKKDYRNPDFLLHAVQYQDIDQIGTCFDKSVFDPQGYDKGDYYDQIEADMKLEAERREHEKKKNQKLEFVPGGSAEVVTVENRLNKKSKWDKVMQLLPIKGEERSRRNHRVRKSLIEGHRCYMVCQLKVTPRVLVGHSFGGKVALSMVEQAAKPFARPVEVWVLDATPGKVVPGENGGDNPAELISFLRTVPNEVSSKNDILDALIQKGFSGDVAQWVLTNLKRSGCPGWTKKFSWVFDLKGISDLYRSYEETDMWRVVEDVPLGAHINFVKAERSLHRWAPSDLRRIHAGGGVAQVHILEDAGHWVHTDNPDGLFRIISSSFRPSAV